MAVVQMNIITVPEQRTDEFEERFAKRAGMLAMMPGFEAFDLLRPTTGEEGDPRYVVYTRWASDEAFEGWLNRRDRLAGRLLLGLLRLVDPTLHFIDLLLVFRQVAGA